MSVILPPDKEKEEANRTTPEKGNCSALNLESQFNRDLSRKTNVLIAVSAVDYAQALSHALGEKGFNCVIEEDRGSAFSIFFERRPELIVLSSAITSKNDGIQLAREILRTDSRTEVMIVLNNSDLKVARVAEQSGVELFVYGVTSLHAVVEAVCAVSNLKKSTCNLVAR